MFACRRPRSRNATVGYSDLKCVVHKLAVKFSDFPNFKVALETQYKQWQPKKMPSAEDSGGYICRGQVVEPIHRRSTQEPCFTVEQQQVAKGPPGGVRLRGRARIPCPKTLGHRNRPLPINTTPPGGPFGTWSCSTVRPG